MSGKKKHRAANEYLQYLKGELSKQERYSMEKDLETDPFEKEAMEGMEMLAPDQAEDDILSLHNRLRKRLSRKRRIAWYSAAASIASLLIIGTVFLQIYDFNPEKSEKVLNEEAFNVAPSTEQAESIPADEAIGDEMIEGEMIEGEIEDNKSIETETANERTGRTVFREEIKSEPSAEAEKSDARGPSMEALPQKAEADAIMFVEAEPAPETQRKAERR